MSKLREVVRCGRIFVVLERGGVGVFFGLDGTYTDGTFLYSDEPLDGRRRRSLGMHQQDISDRRTKPRPQRDPRRRQRLIHALMVQPR